MIRKVYSRFFRRPGTHRDYPFQVRMWSDDPYPWYQASRLIAKRSEVSVAVQSFTKGIREENKK